MHLLFDRQIYIDISLAALLRLLFQLGKSYCEGRGINPPSPATCYGWLLLAARTTDRSLSLTVKESLRAIESLATPEELKQGKELFEEKTEMKNQETETKPKQKLFNLF